MNYVIDYIVGYITGARCFKRFDGIGVEQCPDSIVPNRSDRAISKIT